MSAHSISKILAIGNGQILKIFCMWASGCEMNIKKDVLRYEGFDPQLLRAAWGGEDVDFSFRVYGRFGTNSILFQPKAKLVHNVTPSGRVSDYAYMLMSKVHKLYLLYKNIGRKQSIKHHLKQIWYILGWPLFNLLKIFKGDWRALFYFFATEYRTLLHRQDIKT